MKNPGWNEITAKIIIISRRGAYLIEVRDGRHLVRVWLHPNDVVGQSDSIELNFDVSDKGKACVDLAIQQSREARAEEARLK